MQFLMVVDDSGSVKVVMIGGSGRSAVPHYTPFHPLLVQASDLHCPIGMHLINVWLFLCQNNEL